MYEEDFEEWDIKKEKENSMSHSNSFKTFRKSFYALQFFKCNTWFFTIASNESTLLKFQ